MDFNTRQLTILQHNLGRGKVATAEFRQASIKLKASILIVQVIRDTIYTCIVVSDTCYIFRTLAPPVVPARISRHL